MFAADSFVDLFGLWHWCEREIKKNYFPGSVGDGKFIMDQMTKGIGAVPDRVETYKNMTPFYHEDPMPGNERFLRNVAVRLYYDTDIGWQLKNRRNGYYDTDLPDGSEMINRLMLQGNDQAEFIPARLPGVRSNGQRSPNALSIVDETECIQWISRVFNLFNPNNPTAWNPPYKFDIPEGWTIERTTFPPPFSPNSDYTGMEDIRFPAGWGDSKSEEYWSLEYLFWLDTRPHLGVAALKTFMATYYDGLIADNARRRNIPAGKLIPTLVELTAVKGGPGDLEAYTGTIHMLDYLAQQPMLMNCRMHVKNCKGRVALVVEISRKPFEHAIWLTLDKMNTNLICPD